MDLSKIMTISGKGGLFRVVSETRSGMLVESLTDGRKMPVFATERSSLLEDISIFTSEGDVPLKEVLWKIHEHEGGELTIDPKADLAAARAKFEEILPEYDKDRVYMSDIKKVFAWYNLLFEKGLITKPEEEKEEDAEEDKPGAGGDKEEKDVPDAKEGKSDKNKQEEKDSSDTGGKAKE